MGSIWKYLSNHVRQDFNVKQYGFIFIFLAISIFINYTFDVHDSFLENQKGFRKFIFHFFYYAGAYYGSLLIISFSKKENTHFGSKDFWIKSLLAITALSLDSSLPFLRGWIDWWFHPQLQYWAFKVGVNLISFFTILFPLLVFNRVYEQNQNHYYGLSAKRFDTRPYFQMLLIMIPILIAASFHASFLRQYPMYKTSSAHVFLNVPEWFTVIVYELAYGLDFITVELLFRGFMVIGMITVLGRSSVLVMAVTYCFLHFGKPPGEAISSVVGGYILGVIAFETKSIWGGIIVHLGIAWMMEIIAFTQKSI